MKPFSISNFKLKTKWVITALVFSFVSVLSMASASYSTEVRPGQIRIHYQKSNADYANVALWLWDDVKNPSNDWPTGSSEFSGQDSFGVYADIEITENANKISFLILNNASGQKESGNKVFSMDKINNEIWTKESDDKVYISQDLQLICELNSAAIIDRNKIHLLFSSNLSIPIAELKSLINVSDASGTTISIETIETEFNRATIFCQFDLTQTPLKVTYANKTLDCEETWQLIDKLYAYDGDDLGCTLTDATATLKLWAPRADKVEVLIFDKNDQTKMIGRKSMIRSDQAIWTCELSDNEFAEMPKLNGYYYQFEVTNPGLEPKRVLDPYASSMAPVTMSPSGESAGASGDFVGKAAIIDVSSIGKMPVEAKIENYTKREDAIIYEVHVRDFTSDPSIAEDLKARWGTFAAFKSRISYIRSLGVTHIQLLPIMAWYFGDETQMNEPELEYSSKNNQYNWGYDPQNYFSPDGAYSEAPEDAARRVAELKDLINAIHEAGMGVILDVVYTHMAKAAFLEDIVPNYYFFKDQNGQLLGDFGNNLATNRKMSEKLLVDSVKHWFTNYQIDGMRWDMMGDATYEAVQKAFNTAASINPKAIFIGEGWRTFKGHLEDPNLKGKAADQDWMDKTDNVGVFSDEMRNELKSGFGCEGEPMFLTGGKRNIQKLFANIKAQPENTPVTAPGDMVQYIAAHDNLPLYDVIAQSIKKDPEIPENDLEIQQRIRLGNAIILTSQGTAFIHAGQEFGRTKQWKAPGKPQHKFHELANADGTPFKHPYFIHDSYDSSDAINKFDWEKATNAGVFPGNVTTREFTSGLMKLRRATDAFRLGNLDLVNSNVNLVPAPEIAAEDLVIAYSCLATDRQLFHVFINADSEKRKLTLEEDLTQAEVLVDKEMAGTNALARPTGFTILPDSIELDPLTVVIFRSKR